LPPQEQSENSKFHGIYAGTTRIEDVAVQVRNQDEELETALVIEVGFSQDYESIIKACRSWLEGTKTVRMCVVFFEEEPKYKCPMDEELFESMKFPDEADLMPRDINMAGPFGPALFKCLPNEEADETEPDDQAEPANDEAETAEEEDEGEANLAWVGNISTTFLERWKLSSRSNKAVRCGRRTVSYLRILLLIGILQNLLTTRTVTFSNGASLRTRRRIMIE
jgi:hypothetical protein